MDAHAEREHSVWSASATDRNWNCPGALALTMGAPETTSEAADWGTCAHQIAERALHAGADAEEYAGETVTGKQYSFVVDDEMVETVQVYLDYARERAAIDSASVLLIEQKFSLAPLNPPFDAGGTADAVIYFPAQRLLEVIDFKGGRGVVVEAKGNPQMRTYALGAMLANQNLRVDKIKTTIVQPRAPHKDGRIRSETIDVIDLVEWTQDLVVAMKRADVALAELGAPGWADQYLSAGDHCKFCKAAATCPALEKKALDAAGVWFDDLSQPHIANTPDTMSPEKLAQTLDLLDMIGDWMNAVRAYAHTQAEGGVTIPGYQLVEKVGNLAWKVDEAEAAKQLQAAGASPDDFYTRKLCTPTQAKKLVGKANAGVIDQLAERPARGTSLVSTSKTSKPAAPSTVEKHFSVVS